MYEPSGGGPASSDHIQPDPLLQPGTFIDTATQNGDVEHPEPISQVPPTEPKKSSPAGGETPATKRTKRGPEDVARMATERPDWLPKDWKMDFKVRTSGATAGSVDRYYVEPAQGRKFRSKNEVVHFIETGSKLKRKPIPEGGPTESPTPHKEKKSAAKAKQPAASTFDFNNPPECVSWTLTNVSEDLWVPSIGDTQVPESTQREWKSVFDHLSSGKN